MTGTARWITFAGGEVRGYLALPEPTGPPAPLVVTAHENLGVTEHRQQVTRALAAEGFAALTVDLFSRIGGRPPQDFRDAPERREKAFRAAPDEQAIPDLEAGIAAVAAYPEIDASRAAAVGFCLGGGTVLQWATESDRLRCAVVLYGIPILPPQYRPDGVARSRIAVAPDIRVPLQAHFGGADAAIPADQVAALDAALATAVQPVEFHVYPGAGHAYHDETHPNHDRAAADLTWKRMVTFLREHLG